MEDTEPIKIPITDVLDLHTFQPAEVHNLLEDYLDACLEIGITVVRIIHGKGTGRLKKKVRSLLKRDPRVRAFEDAPSDAGGWGATRVYLVPKNR